MSIVLKEKYCLLGGFFPKKTNHFRGFKRQNINMGDYISLLLYYIETISTSYSPFEITL